MQQKILIKFQTCRPVLDHIYIINRKKKEEAGHEVWVVSKGNWNSQHSPLALKTLPSTLLKARIIA